MNRIRETRERHNLSKRYLAKLVGISDTYLAKIEAGKATPSGEIVCMLSFQLGVPLSELYPDSEAFNNYDAKFGVLAYAQNQETKPTRELTDSLIVRFQQLCMELDPHQYEWNYSTIQQYPWSDLRQEIEELHQHLTTLGVVLY